jgi:8-oxo-dGTP diphosphatase
MNRIQPSDSFARPRAAAGALFFDQSGSVMLVQPTYKRYRDIPGGYLNSGETPREACEREVTEELGLVVEVGPLLAVDWAPHPDEGDKVLFVFDGGVLDPRRKAEIELRDDELASFSFYPVDELGGLLIPRLALRVAAACHARDEDRTLYLENGREVGDRGHDFGHELPATAVDGSLRSPRT